MICVFIVFIPGTSRFGRLVELCADNLLIPNVSECKYLGTVICQKNCDLEIKKQMKICYANVNMLLRRFSKCSTPVKCYLFETYCSNLFYAPLWYNSTVTAMEKK